MLLFLMCVFMLCGISGVPVCVCLFVYLFEWEKGSEREILYTMYMLFCIMLADR